MSKLNSGTLVLNRSWLAVQICSVKRALSLIYSGQAKVVDTDNQTYDFEDWSEVSQLMVEIGPEEFICSPSLKVKIPRVIVLVFYDKLPKRSVSFSRKNIFERDKYQCQYCKIKPPSKRTALKWIEDKALTFDHVVPRSRGGRTTWDNIVTACFNCNAKKGNKTPQELGWKLKKLPAQPKWHPVLNIPLKMVLHKEWANFLDMAYWNTELENENDEPSNYESL
jgi:5-methylcytosine-specific restriction endonuclease McrA